MPARKEQPKRTPKPERIYRSNLGLEKLIAQIPERVFFTMVSKSGLPASEAQELCEAYRNLK